MWNILLCLRGIRALAVSRLGRREDLLGRIYSDSINKNRFKMGKTHLRYFEQNVCYACV